MFLSYVALGGSILVGLGGQLLIKAGVMRARDASLIAWNPFVAGGLGAYLVAAFLYIYALRSIPLSVAFPSVSISYFGVALASHWLWREPFGVAQVIGLALISVGILVMTQSQGVV
jgi:drug/metabolite transporter (DMT)-like permease